MKRFVVLSLVLAGSITGTATAGFGNLAPAHTWSVPAPKIDPGAAQAAVNRAVASPRTASNWHCGTQPSPSLTSGLFTVDYNADGTISSQPGATGVNPGVLADEGIGWSYTVNETGTNQPFSQQADDFSFKWTFHGSSSAFAASALRSFSYCVGVFVLKPWGTYELKTSYWTKPVVATHYSFDPSLPGLNTDYNTAYNLAAMQAVMHLS